MIKNDILQNISNHQEFQTLDVKSRDEDSLNDLINKKSSEIEKEGS